MLTYPKPLRWTPWKMKEGSTSDTITEVVKTEEKFEIDPSTIPDILILLNPKDLGREEKKLDRLDALMKNLSPILVPLRDKSALVVDAIPWMFASVGVEAWPRDTSIYSVKHERMQSLTDDGKIDSYGLKVRRIYDGSPVKQLTIAYGWQDTRETLVYTKLTSKL